MIQSSNWTTMMQNEVLEVLHHIVEISKANGLKPYEYFKYLLEGLLEHLDDKTTDYIDDLPLWFEKIPVNCRLSKFE